jgi:hypothetical protein
MRNEETRMANRPYLDDFVEEQLMAQFYGRLSSRRDCIDNFVRGLELAVGP